MSDSLKTGKLIALFILLTTIANSITLTLFSIAYINLSDPWLIFWLYILVLAGFDFYFGAKWASFIIALFCFLWGGMMAFKFLSPPPMVISSTSAWAILLTIASLVVVPLLIFSKNLYVFIDERRAKRSKLTNRIFTVFWSIALLIVGIVFIGDFFEYFVGTPKT